ncbi:MAG: 1,2-phenylacetyl-CoA epoxidase subunit PaaC [Bacteroidota bacterium]
MNQKEALLNYTLNLGDNALILGQRLSEWCGHGPVLEQDMAVTNIALDFIGQARSLLQYAAELEGQGRNEDDLAFLRDVWAFRNHLLLEQPNGDFAQTICRQFFFDAYNYFHYQGLLQSNDEQLAAIAEKSLKEVTYHLRWSSEWMLRLGDGTELSHQKIQKAVDTLWAYTGALLENDPADQVLIDSGIAVDLSSIKPLWQEKVNSVLKEATLTLPESAWMQSGGRQGRHTEHLGYILADMQYLQRAYPGQNW